MISLGTFWSRCGRRDEVAKGDLRAATYSELALRTSLTRNEPDRVDYLGKAPRGERAQPRRSRESTSRFTIVDGEWSMTRTSMFTQIQSYIHEAGPFSGSRSRGIPRRLRRSTVAEEATSFTPWSASDELRRSHEFYTLAAAEVTSRISVARFPWGLYTRDVELAAAWGHSNNA